MIVFYTRYNVKETFRTQQLLQLAFECVAGMRNAPDSFKGISWDGSEGQEWKDENNLLAYEIDAELDLVAFRVAISDENDELWTADIALNNGNHEIQLRLAREKRVVSVEYNNDFRLPYLFKRIIRDGIADMDNSLPIVEKPIFLDDTNIGIVSEIIKKKKAFKLPVIYVSHPFSRDEYDLDVIELAKDMAGSAHVLVEKSSNTSEILRQQTNGLNAYNGAIDVFYGDDSFRYFRWKESSSNQYRYKVSHAVYARMAMQNIDEEVSLSAIKIRNKIRKLNTTDIETKKLVLQIEQLEGINKEEKELFEIASEENKNLERRVNELENNNYELNNRIDFLSEALKQKTITGGKSILLYFTEDQFYDDEIKRIVLECINKTVLTYGTEAMLCRDYHILKDILDNNQYSEAGNKLKQELLRVFKKNKMTKADIATLKGLGFEIETGGHDKYVFRGDSRYIVTVSNSPSDHRNGENIAHEAVNLIIGRL